MKLSLYKKYTNVTTLCYNSHGIILCNILEFLRAKTCVTTAPFFLPPAPKSLGSYFVDNIFFYSMYTCSQIKTKLLKYVYLNSYRWKKIVYTKHTYYLYLYITIYDAWFLSFREQLLGWTSEPSVFSIISIESGTDPG